MTKVILMIFIFILINTFMYLILMKHIKLIERDISIIAQFYIDFVNKHIDYGWRYMDVLDEATEFIKRMKPEKLTQYEPEEDDRYVDDGK